MLERKDRTSMMNGFEVRVPFCDYRLVEYVWNVPFDMKSMDRIEKEFYVEPFSMYYQKMYATVKSAYPSTKDSLYIQKVSEWMLHIIEDSTSPILPLIDVHKVQGIARGMDEEIYGNDAKDVLVYLSIENSATLPLKTQPPL